jgi:hypothetical protein
MDPEELWKKYDEGVRKVSEAKDYLVRTIVESHEIKHHLSQAKETLRNPYKEASKEAYKLSTEINDKYPYFSSVCRSHPYAILGVSLLLTPPGIRRKEPPHMLNLAGARFLLSAFCCPLSPPCLIGLLTPCFTLYAPCCALYALCCALYALCCALYALCCALYALCCPLYALC